MITAGAIAVDSLQKVLLLLLLLLWLISFKVGRVDLVGGGTVLSSTTVGHK